VIFHLSLQTAVAPCDQLLDRKVLQLALTMRTFILVRKTRVGFGLSANEASWCCEMENIHGSNTFRNSHASLWCGEQSFDKHHAKVACKFCARTLAKVLLGDPPTPEQQKGKFMDGILRKYRSDQLRSNRNFSRNATLHSGRRTKGSG
jgi:hypothetical protein